MHPGWAFKIQSKSDREPRWTSCSPSKPSKPSGQMQPVLASPNPAAGSLLNSHSASLLTFLRFIVATLRSAVSSPLSRILPYERAILLQTGCISHSLLSASDSLPLVMFHISLLNWYKWRNEKGCLIDFFNETCFLMNIKKQLINNPSVYK